MIYSWITIFQFDECFRVYGFDTESNGHPIGEFEYLEHAETCAGFQRAIKGISRRDMREHLHDA